MSLVNFLLALYGLSCGVNWLSAWVSEWVGLCVRDTKGKIMLNVII